MDGERSSRDVGHLEHLAALDAGRDESRRDVDHEPEPRIAAPTLEPAGDVGRQPQPLAGEAVDRLAGSKDVRAVDALHAGHGAVVCILGHLDDVGPAFHDPDLVRQVEIDRRRTDLIRLERLDREPAGRDLVQDHVPRKDHRGGSVAEAGRWYRGK